MERNANRQLGVPVAEPEPKAVEINDDEPETGIEDTPSDNTVLLDGVVVNCARLNVREEANGDAEILGIINKGDAVEIDVDESTDDFYKVYTAKGLEGFCMKQFIRVD